jgi:hypothetical protein
MLTELAVNYAESAAIFGAVLLAMDAAMEQGWIRKFPG